MAREKNTGALPYRHDRRMVGVSLDPELYVALSRLSWERGVSRSFIMNEAWQMARARHAAGVDEE